MKKVINLSLALIIVAGVTIFSCKKENLTSEKINNSSDYDSNLKSSNFGGNDTPFNFMGEMHNKELKQLILKTKDLPTKDDKVSEIYK